MEILTNLVDYFRKIPAAFLVSIVSVLWLILFLPEEYARIISVDGFRNEYRFFLGPAFLLTLSFCVARIFNFFIKCYRKKQVIKQRQKSLHKLTPEEKGYLIPYIARHQNSVNVGMDDGIMAGLQAKKITFRASNMGDVANGFAYNLQSWAREYLQENPQLLNGARGAPLTPLEKIQSQRF